MTWSIVGGVNRDMRDLRLRWQAHSSLGLSNDRTPENVPIGTVIGELSAANGFGQYQLVSGFGDNASFTIAGNQLKWNVSPDFESKSSYRIKVRASSGDGLTTERELFINVTDVNEAPFNLQLSGNTTAENVAVGTVIGAFSHSDLDADKTGTYSLIDGFGDNASFTIAGNQLKWAMSPDFEAKNNYRIKVRVTDAGGLTSEQEFTINVTDVNFPPTEVGGISVALGNLANQETWTSSKRYGLAQ